MKAKIAGVALAAVTSISAAWFGVGQVEASPLSINLSGTFTPVNYSVAGQPPVPTGPALPFTLSAFVDEANTSGPSSGTVSVSGFPGPNTYNSRVRISYDDHPPIQLDGNAEIGFYIQANVTDDPSSSYFNLLFAVEYDPNRFPAGVYNASTLPFEILPLPYLSQNNLGNADFYHIDVKTAEITGLLSLSPITVPLPASAALFGSALLGLGYTSRRKREITAR